MRIGIDIGGTFTDLCLVQADGSVRTHKRLSTPDDPARGFLQILADALPTPVNDADVRELIHATTVATNAILEQDTARIGLITTAGFRDVLEIGRHFRRDLYNLQLQKPAVLVPRERRLEVTERIGADGGVVTPLCEKQAVAAIEQLLAEGIEVLLIGFLNSYVNPVHEQQVAQLAQARTDLPVLTSYELCQEYREYERFSTSAVHAAIIPRVRRYLQRITGELQRRGIKAPLSVMQSNGGMATAELVTLQPAVLVESGPAAGVVAVAEIGRRLRESHLISFDMGGTTAKATLIRDGRITINTDYEVGGGTQGGFGTGYPIRIPVVDLVEIGTGGGSIASVDEVGRLSVGPRSAGAEPGPACYGRAGHLATITDADLLLGRLCPERFAGGQFDLDVNAAYRAVEEHVARPLQLSVHEAAAGIVALGNAQMVRALELVSVQRGHDPRLFTMVAFGGAGPMHAAELAMELGCRRVVIPPEAGVQSAWGLLAADARREFAQSIGSPAAIRLERLQAMFDALEARGRNDLRRAGFHEDQIHARLSVDARYRGQAFELTVSLPEAPQFNQATAERINRLFHRHHQELYGHSDAAGTVEWVTLRATVVGAVPRPKTRRLAPAATTLHTRVLTRQQMWWGGETSACPVYDRTALGAGDVVTGPALVVQADASLVIPPRVTMSVQPTGDLVLEMPCP